MKVHDESRIPTERNQHLRACVLVALVATLAGAGGGAAVSYLMIRAGGLTTLSMTTSATPSTTITTSATATATQTTSPSTTQTPTNSATTTQTPTNSATTTQTPTISATTTRTPTNSATATYVPRTYGCRLDHSCTPGDPNDPIPITVSAPSLGACKSLCDFSTSCAYLAYDGITCYLYTRSCNSYQMPGTTYCLIV
jgi:hypothetical protein